MIKPSFFVSAMFFSFVFSSLHAEDVKITTYYPSPYGSYKQLSVEDGGTEVDKYGSLQIIRELNNHLGSHVAFIRNGSTRMGLGYKQSSDTFGFGPGVTVASAFPFDPTYLSIDSTGKVGIGTTSPGQKLSVEGSLGVLEGGANPSLHTIIQGADQTANITYSLPATQGTAGTVLTNDGGGALSWAVGGGSASATEILKTTTETITSTPSFQNDDDLKFSVGANETWQFEFVILNSNSPSGWSRYRLSGPSLSGGWLSAIGVGISSVGGGSGMGSCVAAQMTAYTHEVWSAGDQSGSGLTGVGQVLIQGLIKTGSTSGTVTLQWTPHGFGGSSYTTSVLRGSRLRVKKF